MISNRILLPSSWSCCSASSPPSPCESRRLWNAHKLLPVWLFLLLMSVSESERLHPNSSFIRRWTCLYWSRECVFESDVCSGHFSLPLSLHSFFFFPLSFGSLRGGCRGRCANMRSKIMREQLRGQRSSYEEDKAADRLSHFPTLWNDGMRNVPPLTKKSSEQKIGGQAASDQSAMQKKTKKKIKVGSFQDGVTCSALHWLTCWG